MIKDATDWVDPESIIGRISDAIFRAGDDGDCVAYQDAAEAALGQLNRAIYRDWSLAWNSQIDKWEVSGANGWGSDDYTFGSIATGDSPMGALIAAIEWAERKA